MLLSIVLIPIVGMLSTVMILSPSNTEEYFNKIKSFGLFFTIISLFISVIIYLLFDLSVNQFQYMQEHYAIKNFNIHLGVDGISIYFVLLTTIIMPISLLSNWNSINENRVLFVIIILLLESLLLLVFLCLDILSFYIYFESILPPLFLLIGLYGSVNRVRASFYLFLYTLFGSLFLLLSILFLSSYVGTPDYESLFKTNLNIYLQIYLFIGIMIAFAIKTPTIFLNSWLLKAHVESPLSGSIILAGIVLKLSLYGITRMILPILPKAFIKYNYIITLIGIITIFYASFSTLRTIDIKELIAYSSVCHAAVYFVSMFSNTIQGIEGSIILGLAHGFVSSGLFICAGGVLYDRTHTRLISYYRGLVQTMPILSILFFILCLGNCGTPLTLNFIGEFLSLYGIFENSPVMGLLACSSIILSAGYTMTLFNKTIFGGSLSTYINYNMPDVNYREFSILLPLVVLTVLLGTIGLPLILNGLSFNVSALIY